MHNCVTIVLELCHSCMHSCNVVVAYSNFISFISLFYERFSPKIKDQFFPFSKADDFSYSCININARINLIRKIKSFFFSFLKFLHGIKANSKPFNPSMTKYRMTTKDSSTSKVTSIHKAPIPSNNGGSDGVALLITRHKLNGHYLQWSHVVMMFICGRGKDDCLTSVVPRPMNEDPKFKRMEG